MWYNQTEVATKEELENVKGMIDVSAKLVYSTAVNLAKELFLHTEYDYAIVTTSIYTMITGSDYTVSPGKFYQFNTIVNKGGSANVPVMYAKTDGGVYYGNIMITASESKVEFEETVQSSQIIGTTLAAYKYSQ